MDEYKVTYKLIEMIEISKHLPDIKKFIEDHTFMKDLDLDMIYKEYKALFKNPDLKLDLPPDGDDEDEKNAYRDLKEKINDLRIKALLNQNISMKNKFKKIEA